jgi:hypothetical protein
VQYWILQHSPRLLPIEVHYPADISQNMDYWHISRYADEVTVNDIAFVWHAGADRGVYDVSTVRSVPPHTPETRRQIELLQRSDDRF